MRDASDILAEVATRSISTTEENKDTASGPDNASGCRAEHAVLTETRADSNNGAMTSMPASSPSAPPASAPPASAPPASAPPASAPPDATSASTSLTLTAVELMTASFQRGVTGMPGVARSIPADSVGTRRNAIAEGMDPQLRSESRTTPYDRTH